MVIVCNSKTMILNQIMPSTAVHTYSADTGHSVSEVVVVMVVFGGDRVELNQQPVVVIDSLNLGREWNA